MPRLIRALWAGEVPLGRAFWEFAMAYGTLLNLLTTIACFALLAMQESPFVAIFIGYMPIPYNLFVMVAVWRSARRYTGPRWHADAARGAAIVWTLVASLT